MRHPLLPVLGIAFALMFALPAFAANVDLGGPQPLSLEIVDGSARHVTLAVEVGSLRLEPVKNRDGDRFWRLHLENAGVLPTIGAPELPIITRFVRVPADGNVTMKIL